MNNSLQINQFSQLLLNWYSVHKRELPWRTSKDPYIIWVSEIILQQTRVAQGIEYFYRFTENFPDVRKLALASEDEVLKIWQGLGYYSRARNMHHTAKTIVDEYDGNFPDNYDELLKLKGIGPYTAAAIASICFNEPRAVLDGNVMRVLARYMGLEVPINSNEGLKLLNESAGKLLEVSDSGEYNQAIMELGALVCTPKKVRCEICPVSTECVSFRTGKVDLLPVKLKKTKVRNRYFDYLWVQKNGDCYLLKRGSNDIWQGLYDMPLIENKSPKDAIETLSELQKQFPQINIKQISQPSEWVVHELSHQRIHARYWQLDLPEDGQFNFQNAAPVSIDNLEKYPVSKLTERFLIHH